MSLKRHDAPSAVSAVARRHEFLLDLADRPVKTRRYPKTHPTLRLLHAAQIGQLLQSLPGRSGTSNEYNGRILVRVPKSVHASLAHEAEQEGVSLNQLIVAKLSAQLRDVAHV